MEYLEETRLHLAYVITTHRSQAAHQVLHGQRQVALGDVELKEAAAEAISSKESEFYAVSQCAFDCVIPKADARDDGL
jgi:hypothetical protein